MKVIIWGFTAIAIILTLAIIGIGWHFSNIILVPNAYSLMPEFAILEVTDTTVTLPLPPSKSQFADTRKTGVYNLLWETGYGRLGEILEENSEQLVRGFELISGDMPEAGAPARFDNVVHRGNPQSAHGFSFEELTLTGQAGALKAWWLDNSGEVAVLMLHGRRRADRSETLRIMPTLMDLGYPVLALAYRNHDQSDPSPDGFYHYGVTEWQDAVTGLEFLGEQGYEQVIIYGFSTGAAVATETIEVIRQDLARVNIQPVALIFDSPWLDQRPVFRKGARDMGLPFGDQLADLALWTAGRRAGIDWQAVEQRRHQAVAALKVPVLIIHGSADQTIPVSLSDDLATRIRSFLHYERVEGADHVEAWNQGPDAYESWVRDFLQQYAPSSLVSR